MLDIVNMSFRTPSLLLLPISAIPSALYILLPGEKRSALLSNILALSLTHTALALLKLDSFFTGTILLGGLFFYDIWFVFFTKVVRPFFPTCNKIWRSDAF
jgi:minor histocompatibility antigen H13